VPNPSERQRYLKLCPTCETLLVVSDPVCVRCGWAGPFNSDAQALEAALRTLYRSASDSAAVQIPNEP